MELFINNKSGAPIYDQIYNQIKQQIISGALQPDEAMPSIRAVSYTHLDPSCKKGTAERPQAFRCPEL